MKKEHKTITQLADVFSKFGIYLKSIAKEQEKKKNNKTLIKENIMKKMNLWNTI